MNGASPAIERFIVSLAASINVRALYPPQHPRVAEAVARAMGALSAACDERRQEAVTLLLVGDDLVVDDRPLRGSSVLQEHFVDALSRLGVEALTLARGVDAPEFLELIGAMAAGRPPTPSPHVAMAKVRVSAGVDPLGPPQGGAEAKDGERSLSEAQLDSARESFLRFRSEDSTKLGELDKVVWGLMDALSRSTRTVLPLAPLKSHDEYTFIHSVNVSLLTLAQGRSFGLQGPMLHAIGLAALVHDIGKVRIPLAVLNKPGRLEEEEWQVMMTHAQLGARHLAALERTAPLSIVVAYEHHLRYDGLPNYPILKTPRRPSLASQMTAISDTYDAMSTARAYKKAVSRQVALGVLRDRAGTFLDPLLVGNFHRLLGATPPAPGENGPHPGPATPA